MLLLHGVVSFRPKLVAFRNDYCLRCDGPRLAFQRRTFDVLHAWFLPVLPLGFWRRWHCSECESNPHAVVRTRKVFRWAGVALLGLVAVSVWAESPDSLPPDDRTAFLVMRLLGPLAFAAALFATMRAKPDPVLRERLRSVAPLEEPACPRCNTTLAMSTRGAQCPACGVLHLPIRAR